MYKEDTIAAIATPPGEGGVAIVRVSGPDTERIAKEIFSRSGGRNGTLRSHTLYYGTVRDPKSEAVLDEVLVAIMRKPHSYTGEDVLEVQCHGGPFLVSQILELILSRGARHAEVGEFTKRAFLNGRLDLAQAEAVLDLIRAQTDNGVRLALDQVRGGLSKWVGELREDLLDILVQVEAAIDFPEEEIELLQRDQLAQRIEALNLKIAVILDSYEWGRLFREGAKVCIAGRPNVGKSSLLNALLGEERAIVTSKPGTTRDVIEESINLGGLPVVLWDTAGIRPTDEEVEKIGVDFSLKQLKRADAILVVLDGSTPLSQEDCLVLGAVKDKKCLVIINKNDLPQALDPRQIEELFPGLETISISAKVQRGLEELKRSLRGLLVGMNAESPVVLTNARHKAALLIAGGGLKESALALKKWLPPEIVAVDLQKAKEAFEEIIGIVSNDDVLERIFSKFCVGK